MLTATYLSCGALISKPAPFPARCTMEIADRIVAFGLTLLVVGVFIIVFDPANLTIFITRLLGPTEPVGTVISLIGLSLAIAGGYRKIL